MLTLDEAINHCHEKAKELSEQLDFIVDDEIEKSCVACMMEHEQLAEWLTELKKLRENKWNNHTVACLLAEMFGDTCACNYNGNDEWLPKVCDFIDTCCPYTVGVACWEQYLKHREKRGVDMRGDTE